ncbi:hypothetical protein PSCICE_33010 [Pseudomonas cichorii]|nr:hypothetical protein PSCICE_33010 [Pseudomonas cichorii]
MGVTLDILVTEANDLMFLGKQVAEAAGIKAASVAISQGRRYHNQGVKLETLVSQCVTSLPKDSLGRAIRATTVILTEPEVYAMLLRGRAPQSEPFRKWVTEEVALRSFAS